MIGCGFWYIEFLMILKRKKEYGKRNEGKGISFFSFPSLTQIMTLGVNCTAGAGDVYMMESSFDTKEGRLVS